MHLREIQRLRRTSAGTVPMKVLQALRLPMPDDVLEQFVFDHGTKGEFQDQYGHLDLHAIRWQLVTLPASEILACSIYPHFAEFVKSVAQRTRVVSDEGWDDQCLPPGAAQHWQVHATWSRPPVTIRGTLLGSDRPMHLVEGHTRLGALRGLVESGMLRPSSVHKVWIGEASSAEQTDERWRDVLLTERMPFLDWFMSRVGDDGDVGRIASLLIEAQYSSRSRTRVEGDNLEAVLAFARTDAMLATMVNAIRHAHAEWERFAAGT